MSASLVWEKVEKHHEYLNTCLKYFLEKAYGEFEMIHLCSSDIRLLSIGKISANQELEKALENLIEIIKENDEIIVKKIY